MASPMLHYKEQKQFLIRRNINQDDVSTQGRGGEK